MAPPPSQVASSKPPDRSASRGNLSNGRSQNDEWDDWGDSGGGAKGKMKVIPAFGEIYIRAIMGEDVMGHVWFFMLLRMWPEILHGLCEQ